MKKILICFLLTAFAMHANYAHAQKSSKNFSFGFGFEAGVVTGDFKDAYSVSTGLTLRASYKAGPGFVTLTSGAIIFLPKDLQGEDPKAGLLIPVKAGYKLLIKEHFFVMGELGYSSMKYYYSDVNGDLASERHGGFTYAPGIGGNFGAFEIGVRYESTALQGVNLSAGMLRLGFNF